MAFPNYRISVNGKDFSVTLLAVNGEDLSFSVAGKRFDVSISPGEMPLQSAASQSALPTPSAPQPTKAPAGGGASPGAIAAPIPGLLSRLLVKAGDEVSAGQIVAVLEAMKMENNITSPVSGVVKEVCVKEGQEVSGNQVLIRVA